MEAGYGFHTDSLRYKQFIINTFNFLVKTIDLRVF